MTLSIFGFFLFILPHAFSSLFPAVRDRAMAWSGESRFKGIFAAISMLGVVLMVWAYWASRRGGAGAELLYMPMPGARSITLILAPIGFILLAASSGKGYLRLWLQNPMSLGIALWSIGHLLIVGKAAVVWFYAAMLLVAVMDIASSMARGIRPLYEPRWQEDAKAVVIGLILVAALVGLFHPYVLGVKI
jgi:uncharacterized membrane protein